MDQLLDAKVRLCNLLFKKEDVDLTAPEIIIMAGLTRDEDVLQIVKLEESEKSKG